MIYDCVTFFNELDLLELRLTELEGVVDRFVIVEAPVTFSGRSKKLWFASHRDRFRRWREAIIHVVVEDMPAGPDPWRRESHQRNAILRGLGSAQPGDSIMVSDLDEIPHPAAIRGWSTSQGPCRFHQLLCYYWVNCVGGMWTGTRILTYQELLRIGDVGKVRGLDCPLLEPGGWHFSYLGGPAQINAKLEAYSHQELNRDQFKDRDHLRCAMSLGIDLFHRPGMHFRFTPLDERFPAAIRAQRSRYAAWIREPTFHEEWCGDEQLLQLNRFVGEVRSLTGAILEIGCWEGRSTVALARGCFPDTLLAVDTWEGNRDEHPDHDTVRLAQQRDVFQQFQINIEVLTEGNVQAVREDCHAFLGRFTDPIKFAFLDASHDYLSVKRTLEALRRRIVPGGILCGNDFATACATRHDLDGGVERAVRDLLPGFRVHGNLWLWRCPNDHVPRRQGLGAGQVPTLEEAYAHAVATPSDIHELLPVIHRYASDCEQITEFGTRLGVSTTCFLHARPSTLIAYDLQQLPGVVERLGRLAADAGVSFQFRQADVLKTEIEPTDLLFIDTWHVGEQLAAELALHSHRVRRYLVLHDTVTFGERGESPGHTGLWPAIVDFLGQHPEWTLLEQRIISNGLTVLGRRIRPMHPSSKP